MTIIDNIRITTRLQNYQVIYSQYQLIVIEDRLAERSKFTKTINFIINIKVVRSYTYRSLISVRLFPTVLVH